jgi:hypothetical protein
MAITLADIDNMPSAEYRNRLQTDPAFVTEVEKLFNTPTAAAPVAAPPPRPKKPLTPRCQIVRHPAVVPHRRLCVIAWSALQRPRPSLSRP